MLDRVGWFWFVEFFFRFGDGGFGVDFLVLC